MDNDDERDAAEEAHNRDLLRNPDPHWTDHADTRRRTIEEGRASGRAPQLKFVIWRYDNETPSEEQPWIVSVHIDGQATLDPPCFATWDEAVEFLRTDALAYAQEAMSAQ